MYTRRNLPEFRILRPPKWLKSAVLLAAKIVKRDVLFSLPPVFCGVCANKCASERERFCRRYEFIALTAKPRRHPPRIKENACYGFKNNRRYLLGSVKAIYKAGTVLRSSRKIILVKD